MKTLAYILLALALCGCATNRKADLPPSPVTAQVESRTVTATPNVSAKSTIVPLPETITATWCNNNVGDNEVITGLQSSVDLLNWITIFETNCVDATNSFTMPRPSGVVFLRAFNRI